MAFPRCFHRPAAWLVMLAASLALAGCEETVDLSQPPVTRAPRLKAETSVTSVQVAEHKNLGTIAVKLGAAMTSPVADISRRLNEALCTTSKKGREICEDLRLSGSVELDGPPALEAHGQTVQLDIPLRYAVTARLIDGSGGTVFTRTGRLSARAPLKVAIDEQWKLALVYDGSLAWSDPPDFPVLKATASIEPDVAAALVPIVRKLAQTLTPDLQPDRLKQITAAAWRHLHYPIELSERPSLWLRGDPMEVRFAGLATTSRSLELRTAIVTRLSILEGERPAPLMPRAVPQLTLGEIVGAGGPILPVDVDYDRILAQIGRSLPADAPLASDPDTETAISYASAEMRAVGSQLALTLSLNARLPELWRGVRCRVSYLAEPAVAQGETVLRLINASRTPDAKIRSYAEPARDLLWRRSVSDRLVRSIAYDTAPDLEATLALARSAIDQPLGEGLRLKGLFTGARIASAVPAEKGIRLNVELLGEIVVGPEQPEFAADAGKPLASATSVVQTATP